MTAQQLLSPLGKGGEVARQAGASSAWKTPAHVPVP